MQEGTTSRFKVIESEEVFERYHRLKEFGRAHFAQSDIVKNGTVSEKDVFLARDFLANATTEVNPPVWATFWEHTIIAPELGKRLSREAEGKITGIDPKKIEFLLWLHELGRLVTPKAYLRNDLVDHRLLLEFGIPKETAQQLPSTKILMDSAAKLKLNTEQLRGKSPFTQEQTELALEYFNSLSPTQRIVNLADNLGKRNEKGLFDVPSFLAYLRNQEGRYSQKSLWPSEAHAIPVRPDSAVLQAFVIEKTLEWLKENGVNFEEIRKGLVDYGPKMVIIARHGELNNPKNIAYNRDEVMKKEDIIHLNPEGEKQITQLAKTIQERQFRVKAIRSSPQTRVKESTLALNEALHVSDCKEDRNFNEVFASGPYEEGLTMADLQRIKGDVYDKSRWGKYNHEEPKEVVERSQRGFWRLAEELKLGEAGLIMSHGDAIGWLANSLISKDLPNPNKLRDRLYTPKGSAVVAIIDPSGKIFTEYLMAGYPLNQGKLY